MNEKTILAAFGGASPEHEVSVITAHQAIAALKEADYQIKPLYITKNGRWLTGEDLLDLKNFEDLKKLENNCTPCSFSQNEFGQPVLLEQKTGFFSKPKTTPIYAVLDAFHGSKGENGAFQGTCEMFNIPCTGSGVMGSSIGMDKVMAKIICRAHGIPVVDGVDFVEQDWINDQSAIIKNIELLEYPVIVKPVHLGSSIGVEVVKNQESLIRAVETAFKYDDHLLVEKVIKPLMEINCSVLGSSRKQRTSVCERPLGKEELLSFQAVLRDHHITCNCRHRISLPIESVKPFVDQRECSLCAEVFSKKWIKISHGVNQSNRKFGELFVHRIGGGCLLCGGGIFNNHYS